MNYSKSIFKILFFIFITFTKTANSQVIIGSQSNYAGSRALSLNPALITSSNLYFDFAIANLGVMAFNDFAYMKSSDAMKAIFSEQHITPNYTIHGKDAPYYIYDYPEHNNRNLYESIDLNMLSLMYNINGVQAIGFSINTRVYTNANNVPWEIPEMITFGLDDPSYHQSYVSENFKVASLEWNEIAFSYSNAVYERYFSRLDIGASLKYIMPYSAAYANIKNLDYEVVNKDSILINSLDADVAYSMPFNYHNKFSDKSFFNNSIKRGNGFSVDLGFTFTLKKTIKQSKKYMASCLLPEIDYKWRLGFSIMDLGFVKFNKNVVKNNFYIDQTVFFDKDAFENLESFDELNNFMTDLCDDGDTTFFVDRDNFIIGLPTTLRLHFDYNIASDLYINAVVLQAVSILENSVKASSQIIVEPRYESSLFEFSIPFSLRDYKHFNIGAMMRLGFLTVGTYNVANYLGIGKTNGLDLYVSVKINLNRGKCLGTMYDACWSSDFGNRRR